MAKPTIALTPPLYNYILQVSLRESPIQAALRQRTEPLEAAAMQIARDQAQFMSLLIKLSQARRALEIGVFTGYSALAIAQALPEDGELVACDMNRDWADIAQHFWREAGIRHKIDLRIAPALDTLDELLNQGQQGQFDFAFIDADKTNYLHYYERCLQLIRIGGLIVIDNVLWNGQVIDERDQTADTNAIRELNEFIRTDIRVDISMIAVGDGLTLALRRA